MRAKENKYMDKGTNAKKLRNFGISLRKKYVCMTGGETQVCMTKGYQGCIFFYNSRPRVAETKLVKGKEGQRGRKMRRQGGEEKKRK